jgi:hypothetical protein
VSATAGAAREALAEKREAAGIDPRSAALARFEIAEHPATVIQAPERASSRTGVVIRPPAALLPGKTSTGNRVVETSKAATLATSPGSASTMCVSVGSGSACRFSMCSANAGRERSRRRFPCSCRPMACRPLSFPISRMSRARWR